MGVGRGICHTVSAECKGLKRVMGLAFQRPQRQPLGKAREPGREQEVARGPYAGVESGRAYQNVRRGLD